ncbi:hypothetical protein M409DRAFT_62643 [Zasmidium cellare ATCC 36951]|uniref:FAD-binding domain-containing protein n=1 Tax=Zasmidium cellare ATCC 36951 TaxID=1080233 RepID=A0A6A6D0L7_ZASCE|nr:uncharacterized protein M409DRAFT_62643 [Zasmidium cellare ATCC 36951]KAF2173007.1 hypothetical protein M409DRAFT_62643 [Zasmidium cellare ATCC 36951]
MSTKQVDVLIVGAGPAGLYTALFLARSGISNIALISKHPVATQVGHASGIHPRTQEILHTLNIYHQLAAGSGGVAETAFWSNSNDDQHLQRISVATEITNETMYRRTIVQHQGITEKLLHYTYTHSRTHPIRASIKNHISGEVESWDCKYMIAADGRSSRLRELAGIGSAINDTEATWAVGDFEVETDFPDLRRRCPIRTSRGNLMLIPSLHKTLRIYMLLNQEELEELNDSIFEGGRDVTSHGNHTTLLDLFERKLPTIFNPYTIKLNKVRWISRYTVSQRVADRFYDGKRLLFVGYSCHSHSPKAAQGMNTGIQDAHNLAWKLSLILRDRATPDLLETYHLERKHIAQQLIEFDIRFAKHFAELSSPEFYDLWKQNQGFTSGLGQHYPPNALVDEHIPADINELAVEPLTPGKRYLPNTALIRHIDGWELTSLDVMPSNGEFHLVIFAGDISIEPRKAEFNSLYNTLTSSSSALTKLNGHQNNKSSSNTPEANAWPWEDIHTNHDHSPQNTKLANLFVIHTANHLHIELRPRYELWKYKFFEDREGWEHAQHGVDPKGRMMAVVVRPDGIVGMSHPLKTNRSRFLS